MADALSAAKGALASAEKKFPGAMAAASGVKPAGERRVQPKAQAAPPKKDSDDTGAGLQAISDNESEYLKATKGQEPPKMHTGGTVPSTGVYTLQKGEIVVPNSRTSEYRKVYLNRKNKTVDAKPQTRQDGGNTPVKGESHDSGSKKVPYKQAQED
jgi:hypothetical protein